MSRYLWMDKRRGTGTKKPVKNPLSLVLILGKYDFSGIAYHLAKSINRHVDGWRARSMVEMIHRFKWPHDILIRKQNRGLIYQLLNEASFILFSSSGYHCRPLDLNIPKNVPWGIWHGGTHFRSCHKAIIENIHPAFDFVFAHRDLVGLGNNIIELQAPFDTEKFSYINRDHDGCIYVGHTPSNADRKNTAIFQSAANKLKNKYGEKISFEITNWQPFNEVMEMRKKWHIFHDKIRTARIPPGGTQGYGTSLVESASLGTVGMCSLDDSFDNTPILRVNTEKDIVREISNLMDDREKLKELSLKTRGWVVKAHGYKAISKHFMHSIMKDGYLQNYYNFYGNIFHKSKLQKTTDLHIKNKSFGDIDA